jgi:uncharacterized protein YecE (DUF72 family)
MEGLAMNLRIGTSGWSYPSGRGTWNGVFYPAAPPASAPARGAGRSRRFDELAYYAEHFDTVEVNSSFYRPPRPETARAWVRRTPPGFEFSLKLYQKFTHPQMFRQATGQVDAAVSRADVDAFRAALDPIAEAGKLGAVLAQFPPSFKNDEPSRAYLAWLLETFRDYPMAVELRHRSWSDELASTLALLNGFGAAWVQIDEPKFRFSIRQNYLPNVTSFYYMRLHGRNAAHWWTHDSTEERYDYLYTESELKPFAEIAEAARQLVRKLYLYLNNHFAAKSVANAVMIKQMLALPITGEYPPEFVARYPQLAGVVTVSTGRSLSRISS